MYFSIWFGAQFWIEGSVKVLRVGANLVYNCIMNPKLTGSNVYSVTKTGLKGVKAP